MVSEVNRMILKIHEIKLPINVLCQKQALSRRPLSDETLEQIKKLPNTTPNTKT